MVNQRTIADPGDARDAHLSLDPISFIFVQILANILPKNGWLPLEWAIPSEKSWIHH